MRNIALHLMYNGTAYHGWQGQKTEVTVAETLEKALATVCCHPVKVTGCGRTDAGVHAEYYIANFRTTSTIPVDRLPYALNTHLPADIVVTNPPFSIALEFYIPQLVNYKKDFLVIGDLNWIPKAFMFPLIVENKIWLGINTVKEFIEPDGTIKKFGNKLWFTNLDHKKRHEKLVLWKKYSPEEYPTYTNYNAINVEKVADIPIDYDGLMSVPISFLSNYNPDDFEIVGCPNYKGKYGKQKLHWL